MLVDPLTTMMAVSLVVAGAMCQTGVGIGFSIIVAPFLMIVIGPSMAVPLLLLLNAVVSAVGCKDVLGRDDFNQIKPAIPACLAGIVLGSVTYYFLPAAFILAITGILLVTGTLATFLIRGVVAEQRLHVVSALSGVATAWTATPGPLLALGLLMFGYAASEVRRLIQPFALLAYGVALLPHLFISGKDIVTLPGLIVLLVATVVGSLLGLWLGPRLPGGIITSAIRLISIVAGVALLYRSLVL